MRIRHLVAVENVDAEGFVIVPRLVRHGILVGARVAELAALIDPNTHLNFDFPDHRLEECVVVTVLAPGAPALRASEGFRLAGVRPSAYSRLGAVAVEGRRAAWQRVMAGRRANGTQ